MEQKQTLRFTETNGIIPGQRTSTNATAYIDVSEASLNHYGIIHGGLLFSLADSTAGMCANVGEDSYVTLQASMNYLEAVRSGCITASATLIRRGKTTCIVDVCITSDKDVLLAKGTFTMYRIPSEQ